MGLRLHLEPVRSVDLEAALTCSCSEQVIVKSATDEGVQKIRNRVVLIHPDGQVSAVCKGCGKEVGLPLRRIDPGPDLYLDK